MTLFSTLENRRNESSTRRERLAVLMASVGGAVLIVAGVAFAMIYM
ncbi:MAG TPA: hypothetical protein VLH09_03200 [Bryobacteraceae bacterium]|nr:hypothetical protein [Bryobacteraceae bacterium]